MAVLQDEQRKKIEANSVATDFAYLEASQKTGTAPLSKMPLLIIKQMRWKQWTKNCLCYAPLLFSGKFFDVTSFEQATLCFISFCAISSGIYVLNDLVDVKGDRLHPTKRFRPIASGLLNIKLAIALCALLLIAGLGIAFNVRHSLVLISVAYVTLNVSYSSGLKNFAILDILCIAAGFVLRAIAGAVAISVVPSSWFLLCTSLGALFLAMEKRRNELSVLSKNSETRRSLRDYSLPLIQRFESLVVPSLLTSYAFYTFQSPHGQWMMMTVPVVLYGVMRYQLLSERGTDTGTPEEVLLKDRAIQVTVATWLFISGIVVYGHPGQAIHRLISKLDAVSSTQPVNNSL